ncbi:hypothetical protein G797_04398, partial [Escherichia coli HVH 139 (4-3192644)]
QSDLSEEQKQTISTLATVSAGLAGGLTGNSTASAAVGAQSGKNAVENNYLSVSEKTELEIAKQTLKNSGFAPIFPDICYHLTHYKPAAADIPVASDNPAHYADAIRYNARTPLQGSLLPLTRLVWA